MNTAPGGLIAVEGLPFSTEQLGEALEAGVRSVWGNGREPLMRGLCDYVSLAIKGVMEEHDIPTVLKKVYKEEHVPGAGYHILSVAEGPVGPITYDGHHGQFLQHVDRRQLYSDKPPLAERFRQSGAKCVAFASDTYEIAIADTMSKVFGSEVSPTLMDRAQTVYGHWWNPAHFSSYEPRPWIQREAAQMMPYVREVLGVNWHS